MGRLGTRTPGGPTYDLHQGNLRVDEGAALLAARVLATVAVDACLNADSSAVAPLRGPADADESGWRR